MAEAATKSGDHPAPGNSDAGLYPAPVPTDKGPKGKGPAVTVTIADGVVDAPARRAPAGEATITRVCRFHDYTSPSPSSAST